MNRGCGWLLFIMFVVGAVIQFAGGPAPIITAPRSTPVAYVDPEIAKKKAAREAADRALEQERIEHRQRQDFAELTDELQKRGLANVFVSASIDRKHLTVAVYNQWHSSPYQIRLQAAQLLYKIWFPIADFSDTDAVRITITDLNGNRVGGQDALWGVWVDK